MSTNHEHALRYEVMGFVLDEGEDASPVSRTVACGAFSSVEDAFGLARELAYAHWRALASAVEADFAGAVDCDVEINDFGYDVRCAGSMVARFWVYDPVPDTAACA